MKFASVIAMATAASASGIIRAPNAIELIADEYIVVFRNNVTQAERDAHMGMLQGAKVMFEYNLPEFKGYSVNHPVENQMLAVSEDPMVMYVEQNQVAKAIGEAPAIEEQLSQLNCDRIPVTQTGHWGLRRVSGDARDTSRPLIVDNLQGRGVDIYVLDTGVFYEHTSFEGRASFSFDATGEGPGDGNGHGTHCAGTAAGNPHGIARNAEIKDAKCLGRTGSGSFAGVIAAIDHTGNAQGRRVGSLSLGGGFSAAVNAAVNAAVGAGAVMSIASGNSNANACNFSPASAEEGIGVNSMTNTDARSGFSNFGTCTDIFAPGSSVLSAWIGSTSATNTISGTSMACPHVTGVAAEVWGQRPNFNAAEVKREILADAAMNRVTNPGTGSPNRLVQTACAE